MKPAHVLAAGLCLLWLLWLVWPEARESTPTLRPTVATPASLPAPAVPVPDTAIPGGRGDGIERVPNLPVDQSQSATASLAEAHLRGDPRTPPLVRQEQTIAAASEAEKADPKAYAGYETRQNVRVYAQFNQAANQMLPQLRADIERGKQLGIAPEEIAKAEEKYRRIAEEQANILKKYPELAHSAQR